MYQDLIDHISVSYDEDTIFLIAISLLNRVQLLRTQRSSGVPPIHPIATNVPVVQRSSSTTTDYSDNYQPIIPNSYILSTFSLLQDHPPITNDAQTRASSTETKHSEDSSVSDLSVESPVRHSNPSSEPPSSSSTDSDVPLPPPDRYQSPDYLVQDHQGSNILPNTPEYTRTTRRMSNRCYSIRTLHLDYDRNQILDTNNTMDIHENVR